MKKNPRSIWPFEGIIGTLLSRHPNNVAVQFNQSSPTLHHPMNYSMPDFPVHHQLSHHPNDVERKIHYKAGLP